MYTNAQRSVTKKPYIYISKFKFTPNEQRRGDSDKEKLPEVTRNLETKQTRKVSHPFLEDTG